MHAGDRSEGEAGRGQYIKAWAHPMWATACLVVLGAQFAAWRTYPGAPSRVRTPCMGKKKTSFVPYAIDGEGTSIFPIPSNREAIGVHKKHYPDGCAAAKTKKSGELEDIFPGLDISWPGLRVLHLDPLVLVVDNFFTEEECDEYLALREGGSSALPICPKYRSHVSTVNAPAPTVRLSRAPRAGVVHELSQSATFSSATASARTSTTWFVAYQSAPSLLARAAALLGVADLARFEEPQLVRYQSGQYFSWHYDAVPPTQLNNGGQRVATLLVYLNDVAEGGCTAFRDLRAGGTDASGRPTRLAVQPKKGRAVVFCPAKSDGTPDDRTLHAGQPTEEGGCKWIAQAWLHETAYAPTAPAGTSQAEATAAVRAFAEAHGLRSPSGEAVQ